GAEGGDALLGEAAFLVHLGAVPSHDVERQRQLAGFETVRMRHRTLLRPARGAEPSEVIVWGNRHATRGDASSGERAADHGSEVRPSGSRRARLYPPIASRGRVILAAD